MMLFLLTIELSTLERCTQRTVSRRHSAACQRLPTLSFMTQQSASLAWATRFILIVLALASIAHSVIPIQTGVSAGRVFLSIYKTRGSVYYSFYNLEITKVHSFWNLGETI